jgi:hypothetical protein
VTGPAAVYLTVPSSSVQTSCVGGAEIQAACRTFVGTFRAGGIPVPVKIADGGRIVRDGPVPILAFIEGIATVYLQIYLDQLRALLP